MPEGEVMNKYPSLCASLRPATSSDGKRGSDVFCTATWRTIGFVWWSHRPGTPVVWHYSTGAETGERNTERNAVQALRDIANGSLRFPITETHVSDDTPQPFPHGGTRENKPRPQPQPVVVAPAAPPRRVVWNDDAKPFDLAAAIAAGLKEKK